MTPRIYFDHNLGIVMVMCRPSGIIKVTDTRHVLTRETAADLRNQLGTILVNHSKELDALEEQALRDNLAKLPSGYNWGT